MHRMDSRARGEGGLQGGGWSWGRERWSKEKGAALGQGPISRLSQLLAQVSGTGREPPEAWARRPAMVGLDALCYITYVIGSTSTRHQTPRAGVRAKLQTVAAWCRPSKAPPPGGYSGLELAKGGGVTHPRLGLRIPWVTHPIGGVIYPCGSTVSNPCTTRSASGRPSPQTQRSPGGDAPRSGARLVGRARWCRRGVVAPALGGYGSRPSCGGPTWTSWGWLA